MPGRNRENRKAKQSRGHRSSCHRVLGSSASSCEVEGCAHRQGSLPYGASGIDLWRVHSWASSITSARFESRISYIKLYQKDQRIRVMRFSLTSMYIHHQNTIEASDGPAPGGLSSRRRKRPIGMMGLPLSIDLGGARSRWVLL